MPMRSLRHLAALGADEHQPHPRGQRRHAQPRPGIPPAGGAARAAAYGRDARGRVSAPFEGLSAGGCALQAFRGKGGDGMMGRDWLGIPSGPCAFPGPPRRFGSTDYKEAAFLLPEGGAAIPVQLRCNRSGPLAAHRPRRVVGSVWQSWFAALADLLLCTKKPAGPVFWGVVGVRRFKRHACRSGRRVRTSTPGACRTAA